MAADPRTGAGDAAGHAGCQEPAPRGPGCHGPDLSRSRGRDLLRGPPSATRVVLLPGAASRRSAAAEMLRYGRLGDAVRCPRGVPASADPGGRSAAREHRGAYLCVLCAIGFAAVLAIPHQPAL